jgi:hypothetical protein
MADPVCQKRQAITDLERLTADVEEEGDNYRGYP